MWIWGNVGRRNIFCTPGRGQSGMVASSQINRSNGKYIKRRHKFIHLIIMNTAYSHTYADFTSLENNTYDYFESSDN